MVDKIKIQLWDNYYANNGKDDDGGSKELDIAFEITRSQRKNYFLQVMNQLKAKEKNKKLLLNMGHCSKIYRHERCNFIII